MFVQIHMLQSMPPGNLNRDETGQPKKCVFGGVTRGRISSQCLKRNIRRSAQFRDAFGKTLAHRTTYLPQLVANELKGDSTLAVPDEELPALMLAISKQFKSETRGDDSEVAEDELGNSEPSDGNSRDEPAIGQTGQLVFFQQPFVRSIATLVAGFRKDRPGAYQYFLTGKTVGESDAEKANFKARKDALKKGKAELKKEQKLADTDEKKAAVAEKKTRLLNEEKALKAEAENKESALKGEVGALVERVAKASKELTVDIALFGRMTTSDLVINVEAACQVAHAIGTHETLIEGDYFTAMDEKKGEFVSTQTEKAGAAYLGSGENVTSFNSSVYYKYINIDLDAIETHLQNWTKPKIAQVAGVMVAAAALANPTGKQNSFAAHGAPELILVEVSKVKRPISYANAFLQPVEGRNLMAESAKAFAAYVDGIGAAYAPADTMRVLMTVANASVATLKSQHKPAPSLDKLVESVIGLAGGTTEGGATK